MKKATTIYKGDFWEDIAKPLCRIAVITEKGEDIDFTILFEGADYVFMEGIRVRTEMYFRKYFTQWVKSHQTNVKFNYQLIETI